MARLPFSVWLAPQMVALVMAAGLWLVPPSAGALLLVPLTPAGAESVARAVGPELRLVARGPLPSSLVVRGRQDHARAMLGRTATLILAPPAWACGGPA